MIASHPSEPGEEPFRKCIRGISRYQSGLSVDDAVADRRDKSEGVFDGRKIERGQPFVEALCSCRRGKLGVAELFRRFIAYSLTSLVYKGHLSTRQD